MRFWHLSLTIILLSLFQTFFFGNLVDQTYAGCVTPALCDAPPGECGTTCNGNQPCVINNNGNYTQTICNPATPQCNCIDSGGDTVVGAPLCTVKGSLCGGSGSNPYDVNSGYYGTCQCPVPTCPYPSDCNAGIYTRCTPAQCAGCSTITTTTCTETVVASCCSAGGGTGGPVPSPSPSEYCGNAICNGSAGENQTTCPSDCGSPSGGPVCGDGSCNGGENCSSCSGDCGACPPSDSCGNNICGTAESCSSCPSDCGSCLTCGNGTCNASESCSTCAADCGACPDSCGDNLCTGFESCSSCPGDCGDCLVVGNQAWWQASNGLAFAGTTSGTAIQSQIFSTYCLSPDCIAQLITPDNTLNADSEGLAITGGGNISTNGFTNSTDSQALGSKPTRFLENYTFFYRNSDLGLNPTDDFAGQQGDILKPSTTKEAYYHNGNVTLQTPWVVSAGESYTVFINGNLTITDPTNANQLTSVAEGGFLAFIVSGDITISETLGNETLTDTTPNLEGIFVADGVLTLESRGAALGGDDRFIGEGSFISWTRVALDRDYNDDAGREVQNQDKPVETFIFRPDLVRYTPTFLTRPHSIWQESN